MAVVADSLVLASDTLSERLLLTLSERLLLTLSERLLLTLETWADGPVWPGTGGVADDTAIDVDSPATIATPSRVIPTLSHQIALTGVIRLVRNETSIPMRHKPWPAKAAALHSDVIRIGMACLFDAGIGPFCGESPSNYTPASGGIVTAVMPATVRLRGCSPLRPMLCEFIGTRCVTACGRVPRRGGGDQALRVPVRGPLTISGKAAVHEAPC